MSFGVFVLWALLAVLLVMAVQDADTLDRALERALKQFALLVPRMVCAIVASGFLAHLIPAEAISTFLGPESGIVGVFVGTLTGLIVPAGPVIVFSIAAVFAQADASVAALIAFLTSWSLFTVHRVFMYELPLLGPSFLRLRIVSVAAMPLIAGLIALIIGSIVEITPTGRP